MSHLCSNRTATCLLRKIINVVFNHQNFNTMDELLVRAGVLIQHRAFLHKDQGYIKLIDGYVVFDVSVQPVGFLTENDTYPWVLFKKLYHVTKLSLPGLLRYFHIDKLSNNLIAMFLGVGVQKFLLSWYRVAFPFLFFGRYSGIEDSFVCGNCFLFQNLPNLISKYL